MGETWASPREVWVWLRDVEWPLMRQAWVERRAWHLPPLRQVWPEVRQAWADRRTWPLVIPAAVSLTVWVVALGGVGHIPGLIGVGAVVHGGAAVAALRRRGGRRRAYRAAAGWGWLVMAAVGLAVSGVAAWLRLVPAAAVLAAAAVATSEPRARQRLIHRIRVETAAAVSTVEADQVQITGRVWDGRHLADAQLRVPATMAVSSDSARSRVESAVLWHLAGDDPTQEHALTWHAATRTLTVHRLPHLPTRVDYVPWQTAAGERPALPVIGAIRESDIAPGMSWCRADTKAGPVHLLLWDWTLEPLALIVGAVGKGKSVCTRSLVRSILDLPGVAGGWWIDGKLEGDGNALIGRPGVRLVANTTGLWVRGLQEILDEANARHTAINAWTDPLIQGPKPDLPHMWVVIDEIQRITTDPDAAKIIDDLARTIRSTNIHLLLLTQRPDVIDTIPGAVRDQLDLRIVLGWMSPDGARMALGDQWQAVAHDDPARPRPVIPGRMTVRVGGRIVRAQAPWLADPHKDPTAEHLWPARPDDWQDDWRAIQGHTAPTLHVVPTDDAQGAQTGARDLTEATGTAGRGSRKRKTRPW